MNCLVPAKLGDLYRAYLLKINTTVSLSRTFGTVFIERILDLFAIVVFGLGVGLLELPGGLPADVQVVFAIGVGVVVVLAAGLLTMRNFGRRIIPALPLPHRVIELYDRFEEGVFSASDCGAAAPHRADRPDLDHGGDAPVPRRRGTGLLGGPSRASAAPSSSPSSARS